MRTLKYDKLTIYEVEDLHKKLLKYLNKADGELVLDLSLIQKIDMTAIQILLSTQKSCQEKSLTFSLINLSDELKQTLKSCGCDVILGVSND